MHDNGKNQNMSFSQETLKNSIRKAQDALRNEQHDDGHWVYELEADATIPAEYILLEHFMDRIDPDLEKRMAEYLRSIQSPKHGGWPLYYNGKFDISATVKAYFALKAAGDSPDAPHMKRARDAVLNHGGAETTNVFTRFMMALFGEVPWRAAPVMPIELMLLPKKVIFSVWNMSYWSRTVIAPLLVLAAYRPIAANPHGVHIRELFLTPPERIKKWIHGPYSSHWGYLFKALDSVLRVTTPFWPKSLHEKAIRVTREFIEPRLNGRDGLGAIFPAMANTVMMYRTLGVSDDDPRAKTAWEAVQGLIIDKPGRTYCQPCVSPIWDTGLSSHAMIESADGPQPIKQKTIHAHLKKACSWLKERQILDIKGDWVINRPSLPPGGWAFQYNNAYYPDVDDTAVVGMLLHRMNDKENDESVERARIWIVGMQSTNGGWGAFDVDNDKYILNYIPFADHGALLDPPTADVTARCVSFLAQVGNPNDKECISRGINYLRKEQEKDGSWFGRWGSNYIYGTWSTLCAFNAAGVPTNDPSVKRAVAWLLETQRHDGGWGEGCESYEGGAHGRYPQSLPSHTAWALLALMAAGEVKNDAVKRGIAWLMSQLDENGEWHETPYNAVGFPRVFYLRYHGYKQFFSLLALSRYRNLILDNKTHVAFGF